MRNLVLFSDGTGNSAGKLFKTNVWRLFQAVDLADPQDPVRPRQFAFYDDGVGTSSFKPLAILGGAFGVGLSRNVIDLYIFLCRSYRPGDQIYAFGFSRGAFTIRVLVGLVMRQGLLRYDGDEAELQRLAKDAYRAYRRKSFKGSWLVERVRSLRDRVLDLKNTLRHKPLYRTLLPFGLEGSEEQMTIRFLGLWDTVDAYGLPVEQLTHAIDQYIWPLTMRDYNLNPRVQCARHALSLDDERNSFHPRQWNEDPYPINPGLPLPQPGHWPTHIDQERISQVWFAGVHSNVGGGYPEDSLSYVPLLWIMDEAKKYGLRFEEAIWTDYKALADENGTLYDSRRGMASYYAYQPRRIDQLNDPKLVRVPHTKVHESVLRRIKVDPDGYAPIVLPMPFSVVHIDGRVVSDEQYLGSDPNSNPGDYQAARENVFNSVWLRRVSYFLTLLVSLALVAMPVFAPGTGACQSSLCFLVRPIRLADYLLPSFATVWTDAFASHPGIFLGLLVALVVCMRWGGGLEVVIQDQMRRIWYRFPEMLPSVIDKDSIAEPAEPGVYGRLVRALRDSRVYLAVRRLVADRLLPGVFLMSILLTTLVAVSQLWFTVQSSAGFLCTPGTTAEVQHSASFWFDTADGCARSGMQVTEGDTYQVRMRVSADAPWLDRTIAYTPSGPLSPLSAYDSLKMAMAVPLRRHPAEHWFQPMARIGSLGDDSYALRVQIPVAGLVQSEGQCPPDEAVFQSVFTARSSGALYFYVNDAVGPPFASRYFYNNNQGRAQIQVTRLGAGGSAVNGIESCLK